MTKQETYDELIRRGVSLGPADDYKVADLKELLAKQKQEQEHGQTRTDMEGTNESRSETKAHGLKEDEHGRQPEPEPKNERIPRLFFDHMGYCRALDRTYYPGTVAPANRAEYDALRPFARREE